MKCNECGLIEGRGERNLCRKCWRKHYTEKNRKHISAVAHTKYLRNRDEYRKKAKIKYHENPQHFLKMAKKTREKRYKTIKSKWNNAYHKNRETKLIQAKTRDNFKHLLKTGSCQTCGSTERLTFHHPTRPYKYDVFQILCRKCHGAIHGQKHFAYDEKGEKE